jgi:hypothetical protein
MPEFRTARGGGDIFPDQFGAMAQWKAEGGEGSGLKVTPV